MHKYKAIKKGFCGAALRMPGDIFLSKAPLDTWVEEITEDELVAEEPKAAKPSKGAKTSRIEQNVI